MNRLPAQLLSLALLLAFGAAAIAATPRSSSQRAAFVKQNPCPATATGKTRGKCPGWVVDHIVPLCADGPDHPSNMQWQDVESAQQKDKAERHQCRQLKSPKRPAA